VTIELDHVIVSARNQVVSAKRLADLLGVRWAESGAGPFSPVYVNDGLTLDFINDDGPFPIQHFCFRVDEKEFDAILQRIKAAGITYRSTVRGPRTCKSTRNMAAAWSIGTSQTGISGRCSR
jgi:catechol 2,3-dioxygenase-like lactoylglutathione lyase family enzyme